MEKAFKYRIYPTKKQQELIQKTFGCVRFVYNYFLDLRIKEYENNHVSLNYYDTCKLLTQLKKEKEWLRESDKDALQKSLKDLEFAYKMFYEHISNYPTFKSKREKYKSYRTSCTYNNIRLENKHIKLPKLGWVKTKDNLVHQGRILNATISQESNGHYYCSLCCTDIEFPQYPKTNLCVGIDLGVSDFAIFSDGTKIDNPLFYSKSEKKIIRLQRELARKTIGSSNWNKTRIKLANLYKHITNQRMDFLHKLTLNIVKSYDIICIEDLAVEDMKKAMWSLNNENKYDVSWAKFRTLLTYKCQWYGKQLIVIDRFFPSSQICNICGHRDGKKSVDIRVWTCPNCGCTLDRDINAAENILHEGLRMLNI